MPRPQTPSFASLIRGLAMAMLLTAALPAWSQEATTATEPPPSEPGSFFRSPPPPAEPPPAEASDPAPASDEDASGMSSFGPPPSFDTPASSPPAFAPATEAPAQDTTSPPLDAASAGEAPPPGSTPASAFTSPAPPASTSGFGTPASTMTSPLGASDNDSPAGPSADGTQSVLTAPPEPLGPPEEFGSPTALSSPPEAGFAAPPAAFETPPANPLQPAAPLGITNTAPPAAALATEPLTAASAAEQSAAMPTGPATMLMGLALDAVESGEGPEIMAGLATRPLPLLEALERSGDRGRRLWITQAYWKVVEKVAVLRWTAEAAGRLDLVAPSGDPHDRATLDVAVASRLADVAAARAALVSAQQELVDLVRLSASEPLPWPIDRPLATSYETHFDVLFASRIATGRIRAIHRSLPLEHEEVDARAVAVLAAETALEMAENDHARGTRGIESVIAAHAALLQQQRALAAAVTRYNDDIVEYVMAVADFSVPDEQFAAMLIGTPKPWRPPVTLTSSSTPITGVPTLASPQTGGVTVGGGVPAVAGVPAVGGATTASGLPAGGGVPVGGAAFPLQ
jgi:hypothetical protein